MVGQTGSRFEPDSKISCPPKTLETHFQYRAAKSGPGSWWQQQHVIVTTVCNVFFHKPHHCYIACHLAHQEWGISSVVRFWFCVDKTGHWWEPNKENSIFNIFCFLCYNSTTTSTFPSATTSRVRSGPFSPAYLCVAILNGNRGLTWYHQCSKRSGMWR